MHQREQEQGRTHLEGNLVWIDLRDYWFTITSLWNTKTQHLSTQSIHLSQTLATTTHVGPRALNTRIPRVCTVLVL